MIAPMNNTPPSVTPGAVAYSYIRFSRTMQKRGRSRLRQQEAFEAWCAKHGVIPSGDMFLDEGKSGYTGDHVGPKGQLRRFLDLVEAGKIPQGSYLVVESLDRLGRDNVNLALERFLGILNAGVNVVTLMDNEKLYPARATTAADLIMSVLVMARANEESDTKAKRSRDNWQTAFAKARSDEKKPVGKQVAMWLRLVEKDGKKEYEPIPEHEATVRRIFDECIAGHGFIAISKHLNADKTPAFRAESWGASSVQDVLNNRCVLGEWTPKDGKGTIPNYFPQIITPEKWGLAHAAMHKRRKGDYTRQTSNFQLWQQIGQCWVCGSSMNLVQKGPEERHKYLMCSRKRRGLCAEAVNVRYDKSEQVFKELLIKVGALGLIQTDAAAITDAMALVDAGIHREETIRAQHMKKLSENPGMEFLYELVATADQNLKGLKAEREELEARHTAQTIAQSDRAWLLANLPLTDRDDRQRANALLVRLNVKVQIKGGDEPLYTATRPTQVRSIVLPIPDDKEPEYVMRTVDKPFLQFIDRTDGPLPIPLSDDQRQKFKEQDVDGAELVRVNAWLAETILPKPKPVSTD